MRRTICSRSSTEVEHFALERLCAGAGRRARAAAATRRDAIAEKLHDYTGLPVDYIKKANLRIDGGEFEKTLQDDERHDDRPARHALLRARRSIR